MNSHKRKDHPVEINHDSSVKRLKFNAIPLDVLSNCAFKFFSNYDLAKISTTSKEWGRIAAQTQRKKKASHVVKEFIPDTESPFKKIRLVGDVMDSRGCFKTSERIQIEIFTEEKIQDKPFLKKTIATVLDKVDYSIQGARFYLSYNDFGITCIRFLPNECFVYTVPVFSPQQKKLLVALKSKNQALALELAKNLEDDPNLSELEDENGNSLLAYALILGYSDVARQLQSKGAMILLDEEKADLKCRSSFRDVRLTMLQDDKHETQSLSDVEKRFANALLAKNEADALALVKHINNPNIFDEEGYPVLARAASLGYEDVVKQLVAKDADLELKTTYKNRSTTVLLEAISADQWDVMKYLVEQGANVNAQNNSGNTALHLICNRYYFGGLESVEPCRKATELLVKQGANLCIVNLNDNRPADIAHGFIPVATMKVDAEKRVESWSFDAKENAYHLKFNAISYKDKWWAWRAIVNKIKSLPVNDKLGLASNKTTCSFPDRIEQRAYSMIPAHEDYVIKSIVVDKQFNGITIEIKPEYVNNPEVHQAIVQCFAELKLYPAKGDEEQSALRLKVC